MRIHQHNTESFIQALATSVDKDPASLENWQFLHIEHNEESASTNRNAILTQLKKAHTDMDCDVVKCSDNDVLFITRSLEQDQLYAIGSEFMNAASIVEVCVPEHALYDLFRDWRTVRDLLLAKNPDLQPLVTQNPSHSFGEIESLFEVFAEAKKLRKARLPLHVMVVEDDPLTRRLVANAFKENYALITAENAQEAMTNYLLHAPDIVFLDIGLPDVSGFEVLHQIVACDKDAYIVMFSANSYLENVTAALSNGASGFIAKPFKQEKMRRYIQDSALHHRKQLS